jgi:hypothetical protein
MSEPLDTTIVEQTALESLDAGTLENESRLGAVVNKCLDHVAGSTEELGKTIRSAQTKCKNHLSRATATCADGIDVVVTGMLGWLVSGTDENHFVLQQLAVKTNIVYPGEPLENMLSRHTEEGDGVKYMGELVLSVKEVVPFAKQLLEVLREIRDRIGGFPEVVQGEQSETAVIPTLAAIPQIASRASDFFEVA